MADGHIPAAPRYVPMSRDEWERTATQRSRLASDFPTWWRLTMAEHDAAVRAEAREPGAGAAMAKRLAAEPGRSVIGLLSARC